MFKRDALKLIAGAIGVFMADPVGSGMPVLEYPTTPAPLAITPKPLDVYVPFAPPMSIPCYQIADVYGNNAYFNSLCIAGTKIGGGSEGGVFNDCITINGTLPIEPSPATTSICLFQDPNTTEHVCLVQNSNPVNDLSQLGIAPNPQEVNGGASFIAYATWPIASDTQYATFGFANAALDFQPAQITVTGQSGVAELDTYVNNTVPPSNGPQAMSIFFNDGASPDAIYDISIGSVNRDQIRINGCLDIVPFGATQPPTPFTSQSNARLFVKSGDPAHVFNIDQTGTVHQFAYLSDISGGGVTFPLLAPVGAVNAPSYSFASNNSTGIYSAANNLAFTTNGTLRWMMDISAGSLLAGIDNSYDIGANGANRPRNVYVGGVVYVNSVEAPSGNLVLAGGGTGPSWAIIASAGHLYALADNQFDIGASGSNRPRTIYVGTSIQIPASIGTTHGTISAGQGNAVQISELMLGNVTNTNATAGTASALPSAPALYFTVMNASGFEYKIPAYNL